MDHSKKVLIANVINFLNGDAQSGLSDEKKESSEVAAQCLETTYDLTNFVLKDDDKFDLLTLIAEKQSETTMPSEEQCLKAEEHKNTGNTYMRESNYTKAVEEYTKAIELNPHNAVYYCNRAAANSRLEKHRFTIDDCKKAIKLDSSYSKAYSRMGIAHSNLNEFEAAREAYKKALEFDPDNETYKTNLKLAEENLLANMENAAPPEHTPIDITQFINNPNLINMAANILNDPNFRNIMSGIMSMNSSGEPNFDLLMQTGQSLASQMQQADPNFVENLRRTIQGETSAGNTNTAPQPDAKNDSEKKTD